MTVIPTLRTGRSHPHPEPISGASYSPVELMPADHSVVILDQRKLPRAETYEFLGRVEQVADAVSTLMVRGAPAIGIAVAYGLVLGAVACDGDEDAFLAHMQLTDGLFRRTRPTAINLAWALDRMRSTVVRVAGKSPKERVAALGVEARALHTDQVEACKKMGRLGAQNVPQSATILTHCNAGALATGGYGSALGVIRAAKEAGKRVRVIATETRPLLQGARLTAWELHKDGIAVEIVTDSMVGQLFAAKAIDMVVVGADRIARSGDVANKIGTYGIACLAQMHGVPMDVAAPWSTVDLSCPDGAAIPIESRSEREVTHLLVGSGEHQIAPDGVRARNPAFDVTPARMIRAIYTERGGISPVTPEELAKLA
jgi:methylthioribose-1-phosphate isomerase